MVSGLHSAHTVGDHQHADPTGQFNDCRRVLIDSLTLRGTATVQRNLSAREA
jgi:hypothetical protein